MCNFYILGPLDAAQQVLNNPTDLSDQSVDFAASISQAISGNF